MNNKIRKIERIIAVGLVIIPIIMMIIKCTFVDQVDVAASRSLHIFWTFYLIESVNIINAIYIFKKKSVNNIYVVIFVVYLVIIYFIPSYNYIQTYAPSGPNSHLMGLAVKRSEKNIYGITIKD